MTGKCPGVADEPTSFCAKEVLRIRKGKIEQYDLRGRIKYSRKRVTGRYWSGDESTSHEQNAHELFSVLRRSLMITDP